jgi:hypothetical protein
VVVSIVLIASPTPATLPPEGASVIGVWAAAPAALIAVKVIITLSPGPKAVE